MFCAEFTEADQAAVAITGVVALALAELVSASEAANRFLRTGQAAQLEELKAAFANDEQQVSMALAISFVDVALVDRTSAPTEPDGTVVAPRLANLVRSLVTAKEAVPPAAPARLRQLSASCTLLAQHPPQTSAALACLLEDRWDGAANALAGLSRPLILAAPLMLADLVWLSLMPTCQTLALARR